MSPAARFSCAAVLLAACLPKFEIVDSFGTDDGGVTSASGATSGTPMAGSSGDSVTAGSSGAAGNGGASGSGDTVGAGGGTTVAGAGSSTTGVGGSMAGVGGSTAGTGGAMGGAGGSAGTGAGAGGRSGSSGAAGNGGASGGAGGSKSGTGGTAGSSGGNGGSAGGQGGGASGSAGNGGMGGSGTGGTSVCGGGTVGPWADWPMPNAVTGGLPNPQSYDTTSSGIVRDNVTGLYWQRTVDTGRFTWAQAATYCATLTLGGCTGWRVPTRIELVSIVDYSRTAPAIDGNAFPNTFLEPFWTSTPSPKPVAVDEARYIDFTKGDVVSFDKRGGLRVRCVR